MCQQIEFRKIAEIEVSQDFPRSLDDLESLADSIKEFGLLNAILVTHDNKLVAGRRRLAACRSLGHLEIAVRVVE